MAVAIRVGMLRKQSIAKMSSTSNAADTSYYPFGRSFSSVCCRRVTIPLTLPFDSKATSSAEPYLLPERFNVGIGMKTIISVMSNTNIPVLRDESWHT
jgi:hypothetical protein